ncbi:MAG TPA: FecR domain-containing protein [Polyangiales bacterium]
MRRVEPDVTSPSQQLAVELQQEPVALDDLVRARMEKNLVDAWRARGAASVVLPRLPHYLPRAPTRTAWIASLAVSAAAGLLLGLYTLRSHEAAPSASAPNLVAHFEVVIDDGAVQSGYLSEGQMLESGKHGHIEVGLAQSRVDISPDSRVRFERLSREELRLSLLTGRVEVAFHPEHKGKEHMSIETRAARVMVVGTRFNVESDSSGNTVVSVSEGVVQVVPRRGGEPRLLHPGEQMRVPAEAQDQRARAVRAAIEQRIANAGSASLDDGADVSGEGAAAPEAAAAEREPRRSSSSPDDVAPEQRLELARKLLLQGKHAAARERLSRLAHGSLPTGDRVEALMLIAESFTAQGQIPRATDAYREAVRIAPHHPAGHNALFALARLLERYTEDRSAAGAAYREYLQKAPAGPLALQARQAMCRLGDAVSCVD